MTALFAIVRALHFACLMSVFGASALQAQAARLGLSRAPLRQPLAFAAFGALATAILSVGFVGGEMAGDPVQGFRPDVFAAVAADTQYGHVFLVRLILLLGLSLLCAAGGEARFVALTAGAALALVSLTSHAAAARTPSLAGAASDALHLLTAGFWLGGLVALLPEIVPRIRDTARLVALLTLFSRWGAISVAVLIAAGTANAVFILDMPGMAWSTAYATWLAVKIVLAGLMVALALTNRFGVLPALARGDKEAQDTIPLTVLAELGAGLAILLIVGILGLTAPMRM
ncbi:MAG: CopD family protein [Rhizomicrobium sp.]